MSTRNTAVKSSLVMLSVVVATSALLGAAKPNSSDRLKALGLVEEPLVTAKVGPVMTDRVRQYFWTSAAPTVRAWVFFTDKGVRDQASFRTAAQSVRFSEKVSVRRAKMGITGATFADLPVYEPYLEQLRADGAVVKGVSRWLNGAAVEINRDRLDQLTSRPFVLKIQPNVSGRSEPVTIDEARPQGETTTQGINTLLNYGNSLAQLAQIQIPTLHDSGLTGAGVRLAIFDAGFRKSHEAFAAAYATGRVLAEWDFVGNDGNTAFETGDPAGSWNHGTLCWSLAGGASNGNIYGPAYGADFLIARTEDIGSETPIEEDNWVEALEWADLNGADIVTSSLGYIDWYTYANMDGITATTTLAANTAGALGILVCNSMGNGGPGTGTLGAPADAFDMLAVGNVTSSGAINSSSSRGPTFDGRIKPEVCARGTSDWCATATSNSSYGTATGTSMSTPLVAGLACLLLEANPTYTPYQLRHAIMQTASMANNPDVTTWAYGYGIVNGVAALPYGAEFAADTTFGAAPFDVQFTTTGTLPAFAWNWDFGDGGNSADQNPLHTYTQAGIFNISLTTSTGYGDFHSQQTGRVIVLADTVDFVADSVFAGKTAIVSVRLANSQPMTQIRIPFTFDNLPLGLVVDSVRRGARTLAFPQFTFSTLDIPNRKYLIDMAPAPNQSLATGSGEVARIFFRTNPATLGGLACGIDTTSSGATSIALQSPALTYDPTTVQAGVIATKWIVRGDSNYDQIVDPSDLQHLVDFIFFDLAPPITIQSSDWNQDLTVDGSDLQACVDYIFLNGPPPPQP